MAERKSIPYKDRKFDMKKHSEYEAKYKKENYDRIDLLLPKGYKELIKSESKKLNLSMAEWIRFLIDKETKM